MNDTLSATLCSRDPHQPEFHQAVSEVLDSVGDLLESREDYRRRKVMERLIEPDRVVSFRVTWVDDEGCVQVNRGYRVQMSAVLGPYKGGLRFHPTVNLSVLKFLAFEQVFKNALTGLPLGGAKGGSDFDPRGRSEGEVMRFCQAFMSELFRHIGAHTDIPAGDIGVGAREIGFLYGTFRKLTNRVDGALTGKGQAWGGSVLRPEATGFGCVYFLREALQHRSHDLQGRRIAISGAGNVALHAAQKAIALGANVVSLSDSGGTLLFPDGLSRQGLQKVRSVKTDRGRLASLAEEPGWTWHEGERPWRLVEATVAMPCATQNELDADDARALVDQSLLAVAEGANMPTTAAAASLLREEGVLHAPGKAANAGGVAVSGLEMSQNAQRLSWSAEEVDRRLVGIMSHIHEQCAEHGRRNGQLDYVRGANIAAFRKVGDALIAQGVL